MFTMKGTTRYKKKTSTKRHTDIKASVIQKFRTGKNKTVPVSLRTERFTVYETAVNVTRGYTNGGWMHAWSK